MRTFILTLSFLLLRALAVAWRLTTLPGRVLRSVLKFSLISVATLVGLIVVINMISRTPYNEAFRAIDPESPVCRVSEAEWSILSREGISNDETRAIKSAVDQIPGIDWDRRFRCSLQTHFIPGYLPPNGKKLDEKALQYDLAFVEIAENGRPYLLCRDVLETEGYDRSLCNGEGLGNTGAEASVQRTQLQALVDRLEHSERNYVVAFVHGWRHNADVGDGNVADLRVYAAHAARFVADRCAWGDARYCRMRVTAVYIGWRGARTDELKLNRWGSWLEDRTGVSWLAAQLCSTHAGHCRPLLTAAENLGTLGAIFTLFDRKPTSETIAPYAVSALQRIEAAIKLRSSYREDDYAPCDVDRTKGRRDCSPTSGEANSPQARMIVFGHSLGGNALITGLAAHAEKLVELHKTGDDLPPPLGNLVVLINPAAEAAKWTQIQRAVWRRFVPANSDKVNAATRAESERFFRDDQRPVLVSVTAAKEWPPGGIWPSDCAELAHRLPRASDADVGRYARAIGLAQGIVNYDQATYDFFPFFRLDFRPLANSLEAVAQRGRVAESPPGETPLNHLIGICRERRWIGAWGYLEHLASGILRDAPFMNTDVENTHAIGHLDPPRSVDERLYDHEFSGRPLGTTHQLLGWDPVDSPSPRCRDDRCLADSLAGPEKTLPYAAAIGPLAECRQATNWLGRARAEQRAKIETATAQWDVWDDRHDHAPDLWFEHGYFPAHLPAITSGNDPFWNMRARDNALANHDGYMLSSFICAMQQLVLDDVTKPGPLK